MGMMVKGFNVIINFFMRTIFIRCLGTEYSGVSSLFTDILTILSFAELGIASAITFELYKPMQGEEPSGGLLQYAFLHVERRES